MPLSRNATPRIRQRRGSPQYGIAATEEKVIFVCLIEVERASGHIPYEQPAVALCDFMSQTSWISSQFLADLGKSASDTYSHTAHTGQGREVERDCVNIRWSCDSLRQRREEGTFFIEPNAQFKILFGCASRIGRPLSKTYYFDHSSWRQNNTIQKEAQIKDSAKEAFRQGIKDGVLLPLRQAVVPVEAGSSRVNISDIEMELDFDWKTYASTEQALTSTAEYEETSCPPSSCGDISSSVELKSLQDFESDSGPYSTCESANTSISCGSLQDRTLTDRLASKRRGSQPLFSLQEWVAQPTFNEPWALGVRIAPPPEQRPMSFKRHERLTRRQQEKLATVRAASERESSEYWIWDEQKQDYKHYDEGCTDPVWYKSS